MGTSELTFIDVFGAPGGLSWGFQLAGFRSVGVVDNDAVALKTYQRNFPKAKLIGGETGADVSKLESNKLMKEGEVSMGQIDLLLGSPPCEGFSTVGRVKLASLQNGEGAAKSNSRFVDDPRNMLYREFVRLIRDMQPKFFVMENVMGIRSYRDGGLVRQILDDFMAIEYRTDCRIYDSSSFGVPQRRRRVFFIGNKLGIENPEPQESHCNPSDGGETMDVYLDSNGSGLKRAVTVEEALGDLPELQAGEGVDPSAYSSGRPNEYQRWARTGGHSPSDGVHNHIARPHRPLDLETTFPHMKPGDSWKDLPKSIRQMYGYRDDVFMDKFKRLRPDRPSWTVVAHLHKDGYLYIHPTQNRTITVREAARLQSFTDDFVFEGSRTSQFSQVGRAVPPLLAMAIAAAIRVDIEHHSA